MGSVFHMAGRDLIPTELENVSGQYCCRWKLTGLTASLPTGGAGGRFLHIENQHVREKARLDMLVFCVQGAFLGT